MQLVAYGAQDIYLTGEPQITFFKSVYRRHTNFAIESILQTINGNPSAGQQVSITISRNGDLLKNLWIQYNPSQISTGASTFVGSDLGHAMFSQLEIQIGGQLIDRHYGTWLTIWRDLTICNPAGTQAQIVSATGAEPFSGQGLSATGNTPTLYNKMAYTHSAYLDASGSPRPSTTAAAPTEAYVPMKFWFCRNPGLAVPLIALQYHEVKFNITFANVTDYLYSSSVSPVSNLSSVQVYADYVYLDTTERRQFAQNAHEYLIDQLQYQPQSAPATSIRLNFNHPVKEIIFCGQPSSPITAAAITTNNLNSVSGATPTPIVGAQSTATVDANASVCAVTSKIILNGTDRFTERNIKYFTRNQIFDTHTGFGATGTCDSIAVYSFGLRPEEHQPSGTCNFSRIDNAQLYFGNQVTLTAGQTNSINPINIYAVNYNVLRIMSGMGGLAYSN
jgi:hypothetical protein